MKSWTKGTIPTLVIANGSFQPSHSSSTQHRALLVTPAEGWNGNYLPAAVAFPDVPPHVSTESRTWQTHVKRRHLCSMSFGKKVMADQGKVGGAWSELAGGSTPDEGQ